MSDTSGPPGQPDPSVQASPRGRRVLAVVLVLGLVAALVLAGGLALRAQRDDGAAEAPASQAPEPPEQTDPLPETDPALAAYYDQDLSFSDCDGGECARLTVPLDYADPGGETIDLAVLRVPARDRANRIGQLVVNPGGPGASGVDAAKGGSLVVGTAAARVYDVVGFDPRGVGESEPLSCGGTASTDAVLSADPDPDSEAEFDEVATTFRDYGDACVQDSGALASHVSTEEVARDLDVLRAALGEPQLDYLGFSYGTTIGATYADLFPTNVGRMVLDGAVAQNISFQQRTRDSLGGFQTALQAYVDDCTSGDDCPLGSSTAEANEFLSGLLDGLDAEPLQVGDRELTEGLALYGIYLPLYVPDLWPVLTQALRAADEGNGAPLLVLADQYTQRGPKGFTTNQTEALLSVNCLDATEAATFEQAEAAIPEFEEISPVLGRGFALGLTGCDDWPTFTPREKTPITGAGAAPIVVVGTTRDPATPYTWAVDLSQELESGVLVSRDGDGHTGFNQGNECVDSAVNAYLVDGTVPADGLEC